MHLSSIAFHKFPDCMEISFLQNYFFMKARTMLLGCTKKARAMLEKTNESGFVYNAKI